VSLASFVLLVERARQDLNLKPSASEARYSILELENPVLYFYLAKCFFAIHEKANALEALDMAIEYAGENGDFFDLKQEPSMLVNCSPNIMKHDD